MQPNADPAVHEVAGLSYHSSVSSSLVLKPTLETIWSLPQDHLRARTREGGLGCVEATAYNPENGEILIAVDRELVLWKVDFDEGRGNQSQRIASVQLHSSLVNESGQSDGSAVVRQIMWVDWLHGGSFIVLTVPHELHIYRPGLQLVGIHKLHERHILCLALHNERHETVIACADGTMKRFSIKSTMRWEGLGLGSRHSLLQNDFELLKIWSAVQGYSTKESELSRMAVGPPMPSKPAVRQEDADRWAKEQAQSRRSSLIASLTLRATELRRAGLFGGQGVGGINVCG
jgi:hypothetical protein